MFIPTEEFGVVPNFTSTPEPEPAQAFGPPDVLADLEAELALLEQQADFAFWHKTGEIAGAKRLARLGDIVTLLTPLLAAEPGHRHQALKLLPVPPPARLMALRELSPVIAAARRVIHHLLARRAWHAEQARIEAARAEADQRRMAYAAKLSSPISAVVKPTPPSANARS